jgi:light-regulated signal transduction histidine kinase (bacteriophytochrome)
VLARRRIEESEVRYRLLSAELEQQVQARTKQLQDSVLDLERSNRDLQQFAYVASHDLQEPLRKVQTLGELLKTRHADKLGDGAEILGRIQSSAARMSMLIHDVLAFSKISSRSESMKPVSLGAIVEQAITDLDLMIQEKEARVIVEPLYGIQGNAFQLGQLFQNLINNALKFHRPDVNPVVQIHAKKILASNLEPSVNPVTSTHEYICVDIKDNGIGFDETFKERIFQVFQRLHGRSEYSGTGIGLAICEKVISNHGGAISVRSKIGQGTTFSLYFPVLSHADTTDNPQ